MNIKKLSILLLLALVVLAGYFALDHITVSHKISGKGIVYPVQEWILARTTDGNLINSYKNHYTNTISNYSVTEFQRGDKAALTLARGITDSNKVKKGDTIAFINSYTENRRLSELESELQIQKSLYMLHASGEKPEELQAAYHSMMLAREEWQMQEKIHQRNELLVQRGHIPQEEFEISENKTRVSQQNFLMTQSRYNALSGGDKREQLDYISANIDAIYQKINNIQGLIDEFTIVAPFSGEIIRKQGQGSEYESILRVADKSAFVIIIPIDLYQLSYLEKQQPVEILTPLKNQIIPARIYEFDNSVQMIQQRQKIFVNTIADSSYTTLLYPGMMVDAAFISEKITLREYILRFFNEVYNN